MRHFVCFLVGTVLVILAIPCWALDVPSPVPGTKATGQVTKKRPLTEEELLVRSLLKASVPLAKMDLPGLMALQPKLSLGESEVKEHLKQIREVHERGMSRVQNFREIFERLKERRQLDPVSSRTYEHLKERLPKWERDLREFPQREAKAMQAIKDWQKLSRIVAATILERKQSGDAQGPRKK
jgi:hypothetical protein